MLANVANCLFVMMFQIVDIGFIGVININQLVV